MIESQSLDGRVDVIRPQSGVSIGIARLIGKTVTPHIHGDEPVVVRQVRAHLPAPGAPTLRKAMDEQNRASAWVACLHKVELYASAAGDFVSLHRFLLS